MKGFVQICSARFTFLPVSSSFQSSDSHTAVMNKFTTAFGSKREKSVATIK